MFSHNRGKHPSRTVRESAFLDGIENRRDGSIGKQPRMGWKTRLGGCMGGWTPIMDTRDDCDANMVAYDNGMEGNAAGGYREGE